MKKTIFLIQKQLFLVVLAFLAFACQDQSLTEMSRERSLNENSLNQADQQLRNCTRPVYVLVHGAWHPESSWNEVKFLLEKSGYIVKTVQLPGLGNDPTPVETVTFQDHVNAVKNVVLQQQGQVILVGHSYAGGVISQVGEDVAHKIKKLIYVSGYMPADGEIIGQWALADTASLVTKNLLIDGAVAFLTPENYGKALYNVALTGNYLMVKRAKKIISELRPHPLGTLFAPLHLTATYRSLEKIYISCLKDRAVTPPMQHAMYIRFPETRVYFIRGSDHSPFVSTPLELTGLLMR